tara:strand:- start:429 stop:599 length:171 start_codon:yes stop_codon:yes gene_type:complete
MGLAMSLKKQMSKEQLEDEYDGSVVSFMGHMLWGDKDIYRKQIIALKESIEEDLED